MMGMAACDVHQFPGEEPAPPSPPEPPTPPAPVVEPTQRVKLYLDYDADLPLLGVYDYTDGSLSSRATGRDDARQPHDIRYIVNAYRSERGDFSRSADTTMIFTRPSYERLDTCIELNLTAGDYRFIAWTDYVDFGSTADKYQATDDYSDIALTWTAGAYSGSNPRRDTFHGIADGLVEPDTLSTAAKDIHVAMARPMARYTFISTDLVSFVERELEALQASSKGSEPTTEAVEINPDDYRIRVVYSQFMPSAFNAFTGRLADSRTGVSYESTIRTLDNGEAEIAFDYLFVNPDRTTVNASLQVLDRDGKVVSRVRPFDIPLLRGHHTIIRGSFLTSESSGEIGIDPDYSGDFNIEIH